VGGFVAPELARRGLVRWPGGSAQQQPRARRVGRPQLEQVDLQAHGARVAEDVHDGPTAATPPTQGVVDLSGGPTTARVFFEQVGVSSHTALATGALRSARVA
jgi:hypothetical protein